MLGATGTTADAQSHYTPPKAAPLSADLASPWIQQLRNKPQPGSGVVLGGVRPQSRAQPGVQPAARQQRRDGFHPITPVFNAPNFNLPTLSPQARPAQAYIAPGPMPQGRSSLSRASLQRQASPRDRIDPKFEMHTVDYDGPESPGTIVIDTSQRFLFLVQDDGKARRYGIGVGKEGFEWSGTEKISRKKEWPEWNPPKEMIEREAARGHYLPEHMDGGEANPLGARALYLGETLYRIHGTNQPWTIGRAVSSGCIRMRNEDVIDLFERVNVGTKVVVS
jgi:lipoprotein-anchoring transpeptidase ErfK/SrfK